MRCLIAALVALGLGGLANPSGLAEGTSPARLHAAEPPLPEGAVARLGTTTFRTSARALCLSPDGRRAALQVRDGIDVMDLDTGAVVARLRDEKQLRHPKESRGPHWFTFAFASGGK